MNINNIDKETQAKITRITLSTSYKYKAKILFAIAKLFNIKIGFEYPFVYRIKKKKI